jgi:hypothetical protein
MRLNGLAGNFVKGNEAPGRAIANGLRRLTVASMLGDQDAPTSTFRDCTNRN